MYLYKKCKHEEARNADLFINVNQTSWLKKEFVARILYNASNYYGNMA